MSAETFIAQNLEASATYLGYSTRFRNNKSFIDLVGTRNRIDLHKMDHTRNAFALVLSIIAKSLKRAGTVWVVSPTIKGIFVKELDSYSMSILSKTFVLWTRSWVPGLFTNKSAFQKIRLSHKYPSLLFYPSHSIAKQSLADGAGCSLLQMGIADSNSERLSYSYTIPANEKSPISNNLFVRAVVRIALSSKLYNKTDFFIR